MTCCSRVPQASRRAFTFEEHARREHGETVEFAADQFAEITPIVGEEGVCPSQCPEQNGPILGRGENHRTVQRQHVVQNNQFLAKPKPVGALLLPGGGRGFAKLPPRRKES